MKTKEPQASDVTVDRFRTVLTFIRMAGVPINMKQVSMLNSTHNALIAINAYALYLAFYMDINIHNDDMKNCKKTFQILISSSVSYWVHLNLRYIKYYIFLRCHTLHIYIYIKYTYMMNRINYPISMNERHFIEQIMLFKIIQKYARMQKI
jgi:hypothetical protein